MANNAFIYRQYDFIIVEQFGSKPVPISEDNLFLGLKRPEDIEADHTNPIKYWKDFYKQRKRPYAVAIGYVKPDVMERGVQKRDARIARCQETGQSLKGKRYAIKGPQTVLAFFCDTKSPV